VALPANPNSPRDRKSSALSLAVVGLVVPGIFATVALPAYAFQPAPDEQAVSAQVVQQFAVTNPQTVTVAGDVASAAIARDAFGATSAAEMSAAAAAASAPSTAWLLANPPYPSFSLDAVVQVALQYQGVPYVFGGSTPAGFDCSGFVMYVYAQFGIGLGHGVSSQAAAGTPIAYEAALPGDLVIMDGHDGFYMGNGMILDAPQPGGVVSVRPIWTDDYYIVRLGI
jgi:cell wall-associated NlpC family hydrolase